MKYQNWRLRPFQPTDEGAVIALHRRVFGSGLKPAHWRWAYRDNPAGEAVSVVSENYGVIVGHYAVLPRRIKVSDDIYLGCLSADTMVDPDYRGQSMFTAMAKQCYDLAAKLGVKFVYGFPNRNSYGGFVDGLDWQPITENGIPLWLRPLKPGSLVRTRLKVPLLRDLVAPLAGLVGAVAWRRLPTETGQVVAVDRCDVAFDDLWQVAATNLTVSLVRDAAFLNWRFRDRPGHEYQILARYDGDQLLGYVVVKTADYFGMQAGFIVDILCREPDSDVPAGLILAALHRCLQDGADAVTCLLPPQMPYVTALRQSGFRRVPPRLLPQPMFVGGRPLASDFSEEVFTQPDSWYFTWCDHDVI